MDAKSLVDGIFMRGILCVTTRDAVTGEQLRRVEIRNKITFLAGDIIVEMWAQRATDPDPTYSQVFSMRMGTSNTPASRSDTALGAEAFGYELLDVDKITGVRGEIEFQAYLGAGDANGVTLQEAGLFTRGSSPTPSPTDVPGVNPGDVRMVARQVHPPLPKTAAITVEYSWRIAFTA